MLSRPTHTKIPRADLIGICIPPKHWGELCFGKIPFPHFLQLCLSKLCVLDTLAPEFSFQPRPSNVNSPTISPLYKFILVSLNCNYYCHFSVFPIHSNVISEVSIFFNQVVLFLISSYSHNLFLLPSSICHLYWYSILSLLLGLLIHSVTKIIILN